MKELVTLIMAAVAVTGISAQAQTNNANQNRKQNTESSICNRTFGGLSLEKQVLYLQQCKQTKKRIFMNGTLIVPTCEGIRNQEALAHCRETREIVLATVRMVEFYLDNE